MLLYVNGNEISAGACCINDFVQADDDYRFTAQANKAHPENVLHSYGYYLSRLLNLGFRCEASVKHNNQEIAKSVEHFVCNSLPLLKSQYTVVVVGWLSIVDADPVNKLATLLDQKNIQKIFFNIKKPALKPLTFTFDNCIDLHSSNDCFIPWCKDSGYQLKNNQYPDSQAHNAWAKYIFKKIGEKFLAFL